MKKNVDPLSHFETHLGGLGKFFHRRIFDSFHAPEEFQQSLLPAGADSGNFRQNRSDGSFTPELLMVANGKTMGLVPDAVKKVEKRGMLA